MSDLFEQQLNALVAEVQANKKYASILPGFIRSIGENELQKCNNLKDAVKETKTKLHQVTGVYLEGKQEYASWLQQLRDARIENDPEMIKRACVNILHGHTSTKERISYLEIFYSTIFKQMAPFTTILDIACGLNPLTIPWMALSQDQKYIGWDVNLRMVDFLSEAVKNFDVDCLVEAKDIFSVESFPGFDVVLLLKTLPCLEQVKKGVSKDLLERIPARYIILSFPAMSLGGANKGMKIHYHELMQKWLVGSHWEANLINFPGEMVYILSKH